MLVRAKIGVLRMFGFERRWLVRAFEHLLPSGADPRLDIGAEDVPMRRFVDDLVARASLEFVTGLRLCTWLVMFAPWFVLRRPRTFLGIAPAERSRVMEALRTSEVYLLREAPTLLKAVVCLGFCGLPPVKRSLGIEITGSPPS